VGQDFEAAYTALLARWPQPVQALDIDTQLGRTRVHSAGPPEAPPMLLVSGGGACSPVWADVANALVPARRVLALDVPGDAGMSASPTRKPRNPAEVAHWLEEVLGALALEHVVIVGHSYGAWLALTHAIHHPDRLKHLVLVDPTDCFAKPARTYLVHALPLFLTPSVNRRRAFLRWETGGRGIDADATALWAHQGRPAVLLRPTLPSAAELGELRVPVSVLLTERSQVHDVVALERRVRTRLPDAAVSTLAGVSHHAIPTEHPEQLATQLLRASADDR
jgi:pimeloyl-ACP methyl ester carboxylesterase